MSNLRAVEMPQPADLRSAAEAVRSVLPATPLVPAPRLGPDVWLKLETLQPTGSFKVRGGLAAVAAAQRVRPGAPLVAASAGNHGLGVAFAASRLGADAMVVVPTHASPAKLRSLAEYDVEVVRHGSTFDEAERRALEIAEEIDGHFISPYNDPDVIAGQATVGAELLEQLPGVATAVVPVGGGGLVSGVALATSTAGVRVVGVEPAVNRSMSASMAAGRAVAVTTGQTIADGLAGNLEPGSVTVDLCIGHGVEMVSVTEQELRGAVRRLSLDCGLVAEGAGAAAMAALWSGRVRHADGPTAVVVTGRNIAPSLLSQILGAEE